MCDVSFPSSRADPSVLARIMYSELLTLPWYEIKIEETTLLRSTTSIRLIRPLLSYVQRDVVAGHS